MSEASEAQADGHTRIGSTDVSPDRAWQHPWLRICLLLRAMLTERWGEAWPQVRQEIPKAIAEKWRIQRAGWFN